MNNGIDYSKQMNRYWRRARANHKVQIIRIIQSFSKKEFDPNNPADILKANEIGQALVEEHYPGRQALVCTQTDGKGGYVHNHILVNDVSIVDGKGCSKYQYYQPNVMPWTDEITSRYTILDYCDENREKLTQAERAKREKGKYCYIDDIRKRVASAMQLSACEEDFFQKLADDGLSAVKKYSKKKGEYYVYVLVDTSKIPKEAKLPNHKLHIRSYNLGTAYGPEALQEHIAFYERIAIRGEFTDIDEEYIPKVSMKRSAPIEEKNEQEVTAVATIPATVADENVALNTIEDMQMLVEDEEELEKDEVFDAKNQPLTSHKPVMEKPISTSNRKSGRLQKKQPKIDSSRFDRGIRMGEGLVEGELEDEVEKEK
ncbi:MAG: relaxase/mobilization nuclease domain-containing protein [Oscillospiraceae bacterium]